ncbi:saccharopepsin [Sarracenia purpurea var. burkii]
MACSSNCASFLGLLIAFLGLRSCEAFGTFGFDVHHRYSDPVRGFLDLHGLPEKGSIDYYAVMAHRDHFLRGRKLAGTNVSSTPLTFAGGNETYLISSLGFLHYANVSVGSPGLWFLVALDTGSDLFWLPCDCTSCVRGLTTNTGQVIKLNIYSPNTSSTSTGVSCNSTFCGQQSQCPSVANTCAYQVQYVSNGTSSTGYLVEDVLHLTTDDSQLMAVDARITFGCGIKQTGSFLEGAAPNGLFGLGMENISVPSILASEGLTANSFSMCFGPNGIGRISFGDKGSSEQGETPFNLNQPQSSYNVSITQIGVGDNVTNISFSAIFDSGTSFTYLNDPAYTIISNNFNSQVQEQRHSSDSNIPFEYCYDLSPSQNSFDPPSFDPPMVNLTMEGGSQLFVTAPIVAINIQNGSQNGNIYCLAVVRSGDINIIGQNFMIGYNVVFDREKMVLGWEASDCYGANSSSTLPINRISPSGAPHSSTSGTPPPPSNGSSRLNSHTSILFVVVVLSIFIHCFVFGSP